MLILVHKILISSSILMAIGLIVWGGSRFARTGDTTSLGTAVFGAVTASALAVYLISVFRRYRAG